MVETAEAKRCTSLDKTAVTSPMFNLLNTASRKGEGGGWEQHWSVIEERPIVPRLMCFVLSISFGVRYCWNGETGLVCRANTEMPP